MVLVVSQQGLHALRLCLTFIYFQLRQELSNNCSFCFGVQSMSDTSATKRKWIQKHYGTSSGLSMQCGHFVVCLCEFTPVSTIFEKTKLYFYIISLSNYHLLIYSTVCSMHHTAEIHHYLDSDYDS